MRCQLVLREWACARSRLNTIMYLCKRNSFWIWMKYVNYNSLAYSSICRFEIEFIAECNLELTKNREGFESRTHSKGTLEHFVGRFRMHTNGNQRPQRDCNDRSMKYYEWNRNCRKTQIYCYGVGKLNISIVLSKRNSKLFGCLRVSWASYRAISKRVKGSERARDRERERVAKRGKPAFLCQFKVEISLSGNLARGSEIMPCCVCSFVQSTARMHSSHKIPKMQAYNRSTQILVVLIIRNSPESHSFSIKTPTQKCRLTIFNRKSK